MHCPYMLTAMFTPKMTMNVTNTGIAVRLAMLIGLPSFSSQNLLRP